MYGVSWYQTYYVEQRRIDKGQTWTLLCKKFNQNVTMFLPILNVIFLFNLHIFHYSINTIYVHCQEMYNLFNVLVLKQERKDKAEDKITLMNIDIAGNIIKY